MLGNEKSRDSIDNNINSNTDLPDDRAIVSEYKELLRRIYNAYFMAHGDSVKTVMLDIEKLMDKLRAIKSRELKDGPEHTCKYCGTVELWFEGCVKNICLGCERLKDGLPWFGVPVTAIILIAVDIEREKERNGLLNNQTDDT